LNAATKTSFIADLDLLRAISILAVIVHHARGSLFEWTTPALTRFYAYFGGSFGVDLFFAISGFIIAKDLVPRLRACHSNEEWLNASLFFWIKRAFRILPSAWFWLAAMLILCVVFNSTGVFGTFRANFEATIAGVLQVANFRLAASFGNTPYGASFVYWSLSLEEQFYLLFPFVIWFARRYLVYILAFAVLYQLLQSRSVLGLMVRTDSLILGILIALWSVQDSYRRVEPVFLKARPWAGVALLCGVTLCLGTLSPGKGLFIVPLNWSLISLLGALLVLVASFNGDYLMPAGLIRRLFLWVGSRSYAMYLCHIPCFYVTRELMHRLYPDTRFGTEDFWVFIATASVLIAISSELNYRVLEVPLRRRGARIADKVLTERRANTARKQDATAGELQ
jgi:peptidoglycan/LPS O-acetylase OafA/YrhL